MKRADYHFNPTEIPIVAGKILDNYKRDKSYFEHYSPKFNHDFLIRFEEKVKSLAHLHPTPALENGIVQTHEKIEVVINSFSPLLNIIETFLRCIPRVTGLRPKEFGLKDLKDALNKRCVWEIQRSCLKIIGRIELHMEEFLDKGFIMILLTDFHLLIKELKEIEAELAEITHHHDMISDEYLFVNRQLNEFVETIIETTTDVFGENDAEKKDEYSVENLMMLAQYKRTDSQ
jgi:hypothetical protein